MSREYMSAVFDAEGALEERLYQIAPSAENDDCQAETHPLESGKGGGWKVEGGGRCV